MTVKITRPSIDIRGTLDELNFAKVPYQKMPAGSVVQYASSSTGITISTTSTTEVDSGVDIIFTPRLANSKVLVTIQSRRLNLVTAAGITILCKRDDSTNIGIQSNTNNIYYYNSNSNSTTNQIAIPLNYTWEDTPNTTEPVKYTIYFFVTSGNGYLADSGGVQLYVTEIAQ